jgi:hypothetical protein
MRPPWSDADLNTLRRMAASGALAQEIANAVGKTRNAVIGQARRRGVTLRNLPGWENGRVAPPPKPYVRKSRSGKERKPSKPRPPKIQSEPPPEPVWEPRPGAVTIFEATPGQCRWIDGPVNHRYTEFCGARVLFGTSWCAEHASRVFAGRHSTGGALRTRTSARFGSVQWLTNVTD